MVEAWLLADRKRLAKFLRIAESRIPGHPDNIENPKQKLVNLAAASKSKAIREDMVPLSGSGRPIGPAYTSRLIEFVQDGHNGWRPDIAAGSSDSLSRCLRSLGQLSGKTR